MKLKDICAQSTLEYIAITTLVIVGILGMGPHVIRSVNAYFKSAEEQTRDSFREEITQSPLIQDDKRYNMGPKCTCGFTGTPYCAAPESACPPNQKMDKVQCSPASCYIEYEKRGLDIYKCYEEKEGVRFNDEACFPDCDLLNENVNGCPIEGSLDQDEETLFSSGGVQCGYYCCLEAEVLTKTICGEAGTTREGYVLMQHRCGPDLEPQYFWRLDMDKCSDRCTRKLPYSRWCDMMSNTPEENKTTGYVNEGACTDAAQAYCDDHGRSLDRSCREEALQCVAECLAPRIPTSNGLTCDCPSGFQYNDEIANCPEGTIYYTWDQLRCCLLDGYDQTGCDEVIPTCPPR